MRQFFQYPWSYLIWASSFNLCTFNSCCSFRTPNSDIRISGMLGKGEIDGNKTCDTRLSIVNTDWDCMLRILATCSGADTLIMTEITVEKLPCIRFMPTWPHFLMIKLKFSRDKLVLRRTATTTDFAFLQCSL